MHENAAHLIPELSEWNGGKGIDLCGWLGCIGRYDYAVAYAGLFWPDFVPHDGCVFLQVPDAKNYQDWMRRCRGDRTKVERVMNHRHIVDLLLNSDFKPTREIVIHLGRLLKDMWSCKLQRDFPDRRMGVEFYEVDSPDLLNYQITVFQERGDLN